MSITLRRLVKTGLASALHWTRGDELIAGLAGAKRTPVVLTYHRVVEDFQAEARRAMPAMLISRRMLERHLEWLARHFRVVSLDDLGKHLEGGDSAGEPLAAVTFDDGYRDVYDNAFPLLKRKGIPAAFFVVTDLIGTSYLQIYDRLYELLRQAISRNGQVAPLEVVLHDLGLRLPRIAGLSNDAGSLLVTHALLGSLSQADIQRVITRLEAEAELDEQALAGFLPLTWAMLEEMVGAGMTVGSHTRTHASLTNEGPKKVVDELVGSRTELERKLRIRAEHLAYPDGRFSAGVLRAVATAGYRYAYTTCAHRDVTYPLLTIPRIVLWENSTVDALGRFSPAIMSCQVRRIFDLMRARSQDHGG